MGLLLSTIRRSKSDGARLACAAFVFMISNWKLDQAAGDDRGQPAYSQAPGRSYIRRAEGVTNVQPLRETPRVCSMADMWIQLQYPVGCSTGPLLTIVHVSLRALPAFLGFFFKGD
jgi:hypothetical protein